MSEKDTIMNLELERDDLTAALQDLLNNEFCSCRKSDDRCPRCRLAISNARETLRPTPTPNVAVVHD